ncbi:MAG TPA: TIGR02452 family protein [Rhabdochlamydiaceae bacterium]|nr:TIGR02452 family protein [Rhabdochlamydiaceae bacterium]
MSNVSNNLRPSSFNHLTTLFHGVSKQRVTLVAFSALACLVIGVAIGWHLFGRCTQNYIAYSHKTLGPVSIDHKFATTVSIVNQDTLQAALELKTKGASEKNIAILDMANANNPGGFHKDLSVNAQEEQLIRRSSMLLARLEEAKRIINPRDTELPGTGFQESFIPRDGCLYLKDISYMVDATSITVSTICSAAINRFDERLSRDPYQAIMRHKVLTLLYSAYINNQTDIVLGAFGCGVYGNSPEDVAGFFHEALTGPFKGVFRNVVFAILDRSQNNISVFKERFKNGLN